MHARTSTLFVFFILISCSMALAQQQAVTKEHLRQRELSRYTLLSKRAQYTAPAAEKYDVLHYRIDLALTEADATFGGSVTMTFKSEVPSLDTVVLNAAAEMAVEKVMSGSTTLTFTHAASLVSVPLPSGLPKDQVMSLTVFYRAPYANSPITKRQVQNIDLNMQTTSISSQSEPYDARGW